MITRKEVLYIFIYLSILVNILFSIAYCNQPKNKENINIIQKDSIIYNITVLDSIKYNIQYRDSIVYNIKQESYEKIENAYNLDNDAAIELFEYLVSK